MDLTTCIRSNIHEYCSFSQNTCIQLHPTFYFIVCTDNPSVTVTSDRVTCIENDQLSLKGLYFLSAYICEGDNIKVLNDLCTIWRQRMVYNVQVFKILRG